MGESRSNNEKLLRGLDWLVGNHVQVINLSLGGPSNDLMASVFAKLYSKGVIIVASAGNGGPNAAPSYPAAYRGVLAVTAVDALDQSYRDANNGPYIAIAAPGVDVWTPDAASGHYVSGTSFSAAVVTGAIGLMLSYRPKLTTDRVRANLCRHARDLGTPGIDPVYGCGLMQISRTLTALE
jgi:minor extracellular protease Epr